MSNSKQNELIITLSCRGEILYTLNSGDFVEEISIGRNSDCTWAVGHVDSTTSSRHAMISKRKNDFYLTDLGSRNGIYLNERKIKEVKLVPGMIFHFGECSINVADPAARNKEKIPCCYLRYTNENGKRCKFKVMPGVVKIGSGDKCDIVLNSGLVSTPHASLNRKNDGSCWLKDLDSRNGTSVNGFELPGKTERMLKNGDVISIADVDMTFHDGSSEHHTIKLTAALLTLVATALVCIGGYFFWLQFTPSSQEFLQQARAAARSADFAEARRLIASAATARKASETQAERKLFLSQINTWENSAVRRQRVHEMLEKKRFSEIPQLLGTMELEYIAAWDWNEKETVNIKKELELIRKLFSCFNRVDMLFNDSEATPGELNNLEKDIRRMSAMLRGSKKSSLRNLLTFSDNLLRKISAVRAAHETCSKIINTLRRNPTANLQKAIPSLETLQKKFKLPFVSGRIENILPVLYSLQNAEKQIVKAEKLFHEMRFKECVAEAVTLPENKLLLAGVDQRIALLQKKSNVLRNTAAHLQILDASMKRQNISPGQNIPTLEAFLNQREVAQVFKCDSLSMSPAAKTRSKPHGQYDKFLGIEYLYGTLVMFNSNDIVRSRYVIPFEPILERAVFHLGMITYFKEYVENNCRKDVGTGKLRSYMRYLDSQLALRDRIVRDMKRRITAAGKKDRRQYFIAHAIAYALKPQSYSFAQRVKIAKEFKALRLKMQKLNQDYNSVLPAEAIKIRNRILKEGLPGDPVVKRMWSLR